MARSPALHRQDRGRALGRRDLEQRLVYRCAQRPERMSTDSTRCKQVGATPDLAFRAVMGPEGRAEMTVTL
jgi:hypothetical protein